MLSLMDSRHIKNVSIDLESAKLHSSWKLSLIAVRIWSLYIFRSACEPLCRTDLNLLQDHLTSPEID